MKALAIVAMIFAVIAIFIPLQKVKSEDENYFLYDEKYESLFEGEFITTVREGAPIYSSTREGSEFFRNPSQIIGETRKGEIFKKYKEEGKYTVIFMFSGEARFIKTKEVKTVKKVSQPNLNIPKSETQRKQIVREICLVVRRSYNEAEKAFPPISNLDENIDYQRSLSDKYKLEIFRKWEVQPLAHLILIDEAVNENWSSC